MIKNRNGLTRTIRNFYGVGDMAFALMSSVGIYYSTYYLTNIAQLSLVNIAFLTSTVAAIDSFTSWIYGAIINSTKPMKWGRYRSWLVVLTWLVPFFYFFQYFRIGAKETVATVFFFIFMLGGRVLQNFPYIANLSMISIVAKNQTEKVAMSSSRSTWNNASKFAWSYLGIPFLALLTTWTTEKYSYAILSGLMAVLMVIGYWIHFKMFKGYEDSGEEEQKVEAKAKRARTKPKDLFKALALNPPLLVLLVADLGKWCFYFVTAGTVVYYFKYIALNPPAMATYALIIAFCAVAGAYLSRIIAKKFSSKCAVVASLLLMAACLFAARIFYTDMWTVMILLGIAQFGYGCIYSFSSAMYADTCVYNEWKTGKNASGWIMGMQNIPLKVATTLRNIIITACLAVGGFSATIAVSDAGIEMKEAICLSLMVIPGVILIVCALVLLIGYRLSKTKVEEMQNEIDHKKATELSDYAGV